MRRLCWSIGIILAFHLSAAQEEKNTWSVLSKVEIRTQFDEVLQFEVDKPIFSDEVKALAGKEIIISGFMIPLNELQGKNYFVLSSLPFSSCFFCGGAGPETVMEVFSKKQIDYTGKQIKMKGFLEINTNDPLKLLYILKEAELVD